MRTIGIIAEGYTDQVVIENVLLGFFAEEEEPQINFVQPQDASPNADGTYAPGGWTVLFCFLREQKHLEALAFNDLLVIHLDTDVCDEVGFDVPRNGDPAILAGAVEQRLIQEMGPSFEGCRDRVVFVVAVDSVECWLLPLRFPTQPAKARKTSGCLDTVDGDLKRCAEPRLKSGGTGKSRAGYRAASRPYRKRKALLQHRPLNPSLDRFVAALEAFAPPAG